MPLESTNEPFLGGLVGTLPKYLEIISFCKERDWEGRGARRGDLMLGWTNSGVSQGRRVEDSLEGEIGSSWGVRGVPSLGERRGVFNKAKVPSIYKIYQKSEPIRPICGGKSSRQRGMTRGERKEG